MHTRHKPTPHKQVQEDITAVQGAVAAGLRIEFQVDPDLTGIVIGKKVGRVRGWWLVDGGRPLTPSLRHADGPTRYIIHPKHHTRACQGERIKRVYEATGVTKIDVTDQGVVRIAGPTNGAVLRAREMLELVQVRFLALVFWGVAAGGPWGVGWNIVEGHP